MEKSNKKNTDIENLALKKDKEVYVAVLEDRMTKLFAAWNEVDNTLYKDRWDDVDQKELLEIREKIADLRNKQAKIKTDLKEQ